MVLTHLGGTCLIVAFEGNMTAAEGRKSLTNSINYTPDELQAAIRQVVSLLSKSEKSLQKVTESSWQHAMLRDSIKSLRTALALMQRQMGTTGTVTCTREGLPDSHSLNRLHHRQDSESLEEIRAGNRAAYTAAEQTFRFDNSGCTARGKPGRAVISKHVELRCLRAGACPLDTYDRC